MTPLSDLPQAAAVALLALDAARIGACAALLGDEVEIRPDGAGASPDLDASVGWATLAALEREGFRCAPPDRRGYVRIRGYR